MSLIPQMDLKLLSFGIPKRAPAAMHSTSSHEQVDARVRSKHSHWVSRRHELTVSLDEDGGPGKER